MFVLQVLAQLLYGLHLLPAEAHGHGDLHLGPGISSADGKSGSGGVSSGVLLTILQALGFSSLDGKSVGRILLVSEIAQCEYTHSKGTCWEWLIV